MLNKAGWAGGNKPLIWLIITPISLKSSNNIPDYISAL